MIRLLVPIHEFFSRKSKSSTKYFCDQIADFYTDGAEEKNSFALFLYPLNFLNHIISRKQNEKRRQDLTSQVILTFTKRNL